MTNRKYSFCLYFRVINQTKERDFLIESGVNPFTDAVYRYVPSDKMVVPPGFEPRFECNDLTLGAGRQDLLILFTSKCIW